MSYLQKKNIFVLKTSLANKALNLTYCIQIVFQVLIVDFKERYFCYLKSVFFISFYYAFPLFVPCFNFFKEPKLHPSKSKKSKKDSGRIY